MPRLTLRIATIVVAIPLAGARAQTAGGLSADASRLRCSTDSLEIFLIQQGNRQRTGTIVDECRSSGAGPARLLTRIYRTTDAVLGSRLDTIVDLWSSLEPRSHRGASSREIIQLDWVNGKLRGRIESEGKAAITVDEELRSPVYNSASFDLLLRAAPLARGYSIAVPAYVPNRGIVTLTAKVVGEEAVDGHATWRLDADFAGMAVTFWVAKTSRRLLKQVMHVAPGADIEFVAPASDRS